jgi:hypothetical protein
MLILAKRKTRRVAEESIKALTYIPVLRDVPCDETNH